VEKKQVAGAIALTLVAGPLGAFIFGRLADRFGRRPVLMLDVELYSMLGLPRRSRHLTVFLVIPRPVRRCQGGVMGIRRPSRWNRQARGPGRSCRSGLLQSGYPTGYLLASVVYAPLVSNTMLARACVMVVPYQRCSCSHPAECPRIACLERRTGAHGQYFTVLRNHWRVAVYGILLMTAFNFSATVHRISIPRSLQVQHGFDAHKTGTIAINL